MSGTTFSGMFRVSKWNFHSISVFFPKFPENFRMVRSSGIHQFPEDFQKLSPGNTVHFYPSGIFRNFWLNGRRPWFVQASEKSQTHATFWHLSVGFPNFSTNQTRATFWHLSVGFPNFSSNQSRATFWHLSVGFPNFSTNQTRATFWHLSVSFPTFSTNQTPATFWHLSVSFPNFSTNQPRATFWHLSVSLPNFSTNQTRSTFWHLSVGFPNFSACFRAENQTCGSEKKKKKCNILYNTNRISLRSWGSIAAWFTSNSLVR